MDVSVSHSNKPSTGIPAVPESAPQKGTLTWGRGARVIPLPVSPALSGAHPSGL